ncbi:MAG: PD-(D/E)XK nuclease domain-containing protein [Bacteroidales bacterium]|nr:PD-(D/E)XK nuclease domain-containing protein [Bacteroidales bacterium]
MLIPFFAAIPYDITLKQEKYYQTVIHLVFRMLGLYCQPEVKIAAGRIDTLVETRNYVYSQWGLIPRPSGLNLTHGILSSAGAYRR